MAEQNHLNNKGTLLMDGFRSVLRPLIVADRIAGMRNIEIAAKHGIDPKAVGHHLRRAILYGEVSREQLRLRPKKVEDRETYDQRWLARLKESTLVDPVKGCWLWQGYRHPRRGYGQTTYRGRNVTIHRQVFKVVKKTEIPAGLLICHECDVTNCWNPDHLWAGTPAQNSLDMVKKGRCHEWSVTHCPQGHPYDEHNTRWLTAASGRPARECKECTRNRHRRRHQRTRELGETHDR